MTCSPELNLQRRCQVSAAEDHHVEHVVDGCGVRGAVILQPAERRLSHFIERADLTVKDGVLWKTRDMKEDLPYPKERKSLPVILSPGEVEQLIAGARNLYHRTLLMTLYSTGLRRAELCRLKVADIDSKRMMLRVVQGKGGIDREVPLSKTLLPTLREYYRWMKPQTYLVSGYGKRLACR